VRRILVVELLGGLGDVLMVLPSVHALARSHPGAEVNVLTFAPGDRLLAADPYVAEVVAVVPGPEGTARAAVERELRRRQYDLVVSTTRYDGIGELCAAAAPRSVTDLWRRPPATERVDRRYLRLLAADGAIDAAHADLPVRVHLTGSERAAGGRALARAAPGRNAPVVLVPDSGMRVKEWPAGCPVVAVTPPAGAAAPRGATPLPPSDLRRLAAMLAAVAARGGVAVGGDTGPLRLAAAVGARTVGLFGPTLASRYGLAGPEPGSVDLQGRPGCAVRRPVAISEQECWWTAACPLAGGGRPACLDDIGVDAVLAHLGEPAAATTRGGPLLAATLPGRW
jgi:ADP-heptose:LPS heptosyltransferase